MRPNLSQFHPQKHRKIAQSVRTVDFATDSVYRNAQIVAHTAAGLYGFPTSCKAGELVRESMLCHRGRRTLRRRCACRAVVVRVGLQFRFKSRQCLAGGRRGARCRIYVPARRPRRLTGCNFINVLRHIWYAGRRKTRCMGARKRFCRRYAGHRPLPLPPAPAHHLALRRTGFV